MWQIIDMYIGIVIMTIGVFYFDKIVLNEPLKISKIKLFILICLVSIFHTMMYLKLDGLLKTVLMCIINTTLCKCSFKVTISKSIMITFMYMVLLIIPDALVIIVATKLLGINESFFYTKFTGSALGNLCICITFLILTYCIRKPLRNILNTKVETNKKIIIYLILTFICVAIIFYQTFNNIIISIDLVISIFIMIAFIIILLSLIRQTIKNNNLINQYDKLLEFMVTYENEIENQRILRHEIKNEFRTIRAKICDNQENKEIVEYIDEIVNDKYEVDKEKYAKFGYLPANGIKGLCYFKTQEAEDKGVSISLNISKRIKESTVYNLSLKEQRDFGRILGVFLDNAIEASLETEEKQLGIEAYVNSEKEFRMIITNTYNNTIDKNKIGIENFSTKGKTRGHGLLLVKQLVEKNKLFEIKTDIQENIYVQTIEIKKL